MTAVEGQLDRWTLWGQENVLQKQREISKNLENKGGGLDWTVGGSYLRALFLSSVDNWPMYSTINLWEPSRWVSRRSHGKCYNFFTFSNRFIQFLPEKASSCPPISVSHFYLLPFSHISGFRGSFRYELSSISWVAHWATRPNYQEGQLPPPRVGQLNPYSAIPSHMSVFVGAVDSWMNYAKEQENGWESTATERTLLYTWWNRSASPFFTGPSAACGGAGIKI